jgi:Asp-tRNA(Asn)/Glu-tRNA(Gln) amidotransferase C subunit
VPKEALDFKCVRRVKAVRSIGYGSPAMRELVSSKLGAMLPMMDETSRRNAQRTMLAPYVGQSQVDAYFPPASDAGIPDDHAALATLENNALRTPNGEVLVTPNQNAVTHFQIHFSDLADHFKQLQAKQAQPLEVLLHAHQAGPHMRQHLNTLVNDPTRKDQLAPMEAAYQHISKMTDQLQQQTMQATKAQQAQQQQEAPPPQPDPQAIAALAKVRGDLNLKAMKAHGDLQLKAQKQDALLKLKDAQTAHDMRLKTATAMQPPIVAAEPSAAQPTAATV